MCESSGGSGREAWSNVVKRVGPSSGGSAGAGFAAGGVPLHDQATEVLGYNDIFNSGHDYT